MTNKYTSEHPRYKVYLEERTQRIYENVKESNQNQWMEYWDVIKDMDINNCCTSEIMALINYCINLGNNASNVLWSVHICPIEEK